MANKLVLTTALLLALVAFATATRFTTTVVIDEERDPRESQSQSQSQSQQQCQSQVQGRQFQSCQSYLSPQQSRRPYFDEQGGYIEIRHHQGQGQQGSEQENLRQCCEELQNVNQQCRCQAIEHVVRQELQQLEQQQQQQPGRQGSRWQGQGQQQPSRQQLEQVYQKARDLPKQCKFRQPQQCEIRPEQIGSA